MCRVQVLNHDEGHAGCPQGAEKLNQRFEASGGGANSHDEEGGATVLRHGQSIGSAADLRADRVLPPRRL